MRKYKVGDRIRLTGYRDSKDRSSGFIKSYKDMIGVTGTLTRHTPKSIREWLVTYDNELMPASREFTKTWAIGEHEMEKIAFEQDKNGNLV